jgi:antibiotic biosynthesis monooxygenase (ABM) superfamily enzyme
MVVMLNWIMVPLLSRIFAPFLRPWPTTAFDYFIEVTIE